MSTRLSILCLSLAAATTIVLPGLAQVSPLLVYNASSSVPRGWYVISHPTSIQVGDLVLAHLPAAPAALAAQRNYIRATVPVLKRVGALEPQTVCIERGAVLIDGLHVADARAIDGHRRPMPIASLCRKLARDEIFLLSTHSLDSFDGRYFGPIRRERIIGTAHAVWTP